MGDVFAFLQVALILHDGLSSLYRGLLPTLFGIFPYAALSFFTFETLKSRVLSKHRDDPPCLTPMESLICGGVAGVASQTATYPIDTIRKVMQANAFLYHFRVSSVNF